MTKAEERASRIEFESYIKERYPNAIFKYPETDDGFSGAGKDIFWIPGQELQFYTSKEAFERDFESVGSCYMMNFHLHITFDF